MTLKEEVFNIVRTIPVGKIMTYKQVANRAGTKGYQAIGQILKQNFNPQIPCHRVIKTNLEIGGYNRGTEAKIKRLQDEGVNTNNLAEFLVE